MASAKLYSSSKRWCHATAVWHATTHWINKSALATNCNAFFFCFVGDSDADQTIWLQPQQRDREFIMEVSLSHYMSSWHFQKSLKQSRAWHNKLVKGDRTRFYILLMFLIRGFELLPALFAGISETNFHKVLIMWINETFTAWKKKGKGKKDLLIGEP